MRIAIGCDDAGFPLKEPITRALESEGHDVLDLGTFSTEPVDYPDYARAVGQAVLRGFVDVSVLISGSGIGGAIAANKMRGVRAALCYDAAQARRSREEEHANVLCLSANALDARAAIEVTKAWIATRFSGAEPFARRVAKIGQLEAGLLGPEKVPSKPGAPDTLVPPAPAPRERPPEPAPAVAQAARNTLSEDASELLRQVTGSQSDPLSTELETALVGRAAGNPRKADAAPTRRTQPMPDVLKLPVVEETLQYLESKDFLDRLWVKDANLWKGDTAAIRNRLGWLTSPTIMRGHAEDIKAFADEVRRLQFSQVVLLGMGGSSLASDTFNATFGSKMGFPDLLILDSTDPGAIRHVLESVSLGRTLFVVSTKSGTTTETLAFYSFFRAQVEAASPPKPGMQFVAITDPGRPLDKLATESGFRRTFLNPASIGGRYSAVSFFGLVPAALIGVDIKALLERAHAMVEICGNEVGARDNPAVQLGAALAGLAKIGRDKVTLVLSQKIRALGAWIEQLLAESLGKDGKGVVPVVDEPLGPPAVYGDDRVFVALTLEDDDSYDAALGKLAEAGHPARAQGPARSGRRVLPLGDGHRDRRRGHGRESLRRARRGARQGEHLGPAGHLEEESPAARVAARRRRRRHRPDGQVEQKDPVRGQGAVGPSGPGRGRRLPGNPGLPHAQRGDREPAAGGAHDSARPAPHGDDGGLRAALLAFHRPAAQGRASERPLHPDHLRRQGRPADPGLELRVQHAQGRPGARRSPGPARRRPPRDPSASHGPAGDRTAAAPADDPGGDPKGVKRKAFA